MTGQQCVKTDRRSTLENRTFLSNRMFLRELKFSKIEFRCCRVGITNASGLPIGGRVDYRVGGGLKVSGGRLRFAITGRAIHPGHLARKMKASTQRPVLPRSLMKRWNVREREKGREREGGEIPSRRVFLSRVSRRVDRISRARHLRFSLIFTKWETSSNLSAGRGDEKKKFERDINPFSADISLRVQMVPGYTAVVREFCLEIDL